MFENGIFQPAGDGKVAFALRREMGEAMANVLINERSENKVYRFTGSEAYSFYDVATALSQLSGREVKYTPIGTSAFMEMMKAKGLPEAVMQKIINFNTDIANGQEATITNDLEMMLCRKPADLEEGLKILFGDYLNLKKENENYCNRFFREHQQASHDRVGTKRSPGNGGEQQCP